MELKSGRWSKRVKISGDKKPSTNHSGSRGDHTVLNLKNLSGLAPKKLKQKL
jgi:hypothetical protein